MELNELKKYVELGYSHRKIGKELNCSESNIKYWLNKYELKTIKKEKNEFCTLCGNLIKNNIANRSNCQSCVTRIRRYRTKQRAVKLLDGKCNRCGWSGNIAAFEFHHPDDNKKFGIADISNKSWKVVKKEIQKCELLCSNCHRIEHTKYNKNEIFMNAVNNYK